MCDRTLCFYNINMTNIIYLFIVLSNLHGDLILQKCEKGCLIEYRLCHFQVVIYKSFFEPILSASSCWVSPARLRSSLSVCNLSSCFFGLSHIELIEIVFVESYFSARYMFVFSMSKLTKKFTYSKLYFNFNRKKLSKSSLSLFEIMIMCHRICLRS